ncbi:MAG: PadR family transcriptional regulator [Bacillota bacterium]
MRTEKGDKTAGDYPAIQLEKLVQPAILLLLAQSPSHGYELIQKLARMDCVKGDPDTATIYRTLRRMDQEGLVASGWEHGEYGPARRQYRLTGEGLVLLDRWTRILEGRVKQIECFISLYKKLDKDNRPVTNKKPGEDPNEVRREYAENIACRSFEKADEGDCAPFQGKIP